jgi:hypothetical protein
VARATPKWRLSLSSNIANANSTLTAYRNWVKDPQVRNLPHPFYTQVKISPCAREDSFRPSPHPLPPLTSPSFHTNMLTIYYSLTAALLLVPAAAQIFYPVCSSSWSWVRDLQLNNPIPQRILQNLPYSSRSTPSGRVPAKSLGFCRVYVTTEVRSPILG